MLPSDALHPSEKRLDELHLGELSASEAAEVEQHIATCIACRRRLDLRREGFGAFPELEPDGLLERIRAASAPQSAGDERPKKKSWRRSWIALGSAIAAAAALVLFLRAGSDAELHTGGSEEVIRAKGGLALTVYVRRNGQVQPVQSGDEFAEGDRLRFAVRTPASHDYAMLLGIEEDGSTSVYFPVSGADRAALIDSDGDGTLPGAIELDDYRGVEMLHLVACADAFAVPDLTIRGQSVSPPDGCMSTSFELRKP